MATVTTVRPASTTTNNWIIVDTTAHGAVSDDSDATYLENDDVNPAGSVAAFPITEPSAPVDNELHRFRTRARLAATGGSVLFRLRRLSSPAQDSQSSRVAPGAATTFNGPWVRPADGVTEPYTWTGEGTDDPFDPQDPRLVEAYADFEFRNKPTFTPDVEDGGGSSVAGGILNDTNQARLVFGPIDRDGLTARSWTVEVEGTSGVVFTDSGSGTPPSEIITTPLDNDSYTARFQAFTTIRQNDAFASDVETVTFTVDFTPPNAPECDMTPTADPPSIEVCWTDPTSPGFSPGDTEWDDEAEVVSEVRRTDCNGTETIFAALTYEDCHVDRFMSLSTQGVFCGEDDHTCQVCYQVRWRGRVDGIIVVTEWSEECCVASLPNPEPGCDWLRGAASGDVCICPDRTYERSRPFGAFQPIGGGLPTVVTGVPGGRNYTLSFPVEDEDELVLVESILDQPLNYFQPDDQRDLWMAPNPESVTVTKVQRIRLVDASFVEVEPEPISDPESLVPPASGSP